MTIYLSNRDGDGKTNEEGHYKFQTSLFAGDVVGADSLKVVQNSPLGRNVIVSAGQYKIDTPEGYSYTGWSTSNEVVSISTADAANPRITTIVAYVDKNATTSPTPPNNPGVTKLAAVNGTPSVIPAAPNATTIQTQIGAGNPYIILADVRVDAVASQITNSNISDRRTQVAVSDKLVGPTSIGINSVNTGNIADLSVTNGKLAENSVTGDKVVNGSLTDLKWRNRIAFYARRTGARTLTATTFTLMAADTIIYNLGGGYSNAANAGRFTAPVSGIYSFYANLNSAAATNTRIIVEIRINGSANNSRVCDFNATSIRAGNGTTFAQMNAGDYCECFVWTQAATNIASSGASPSEFGGYLITRI